MGWYWRRASTRRWCNGWDRIADRGGGCHRFRRPFDRRALNAFWTLDSRPLNNGPFNNGPICRQALAYLAWLASRFITWRVAPLVVALIVAPRFWSLIRSRLCPLLWPWVGRRTIATALLILAAIASTFVHAAVVALIAARFVATIAAVAVAATGTVFKPVLVLIAVLVLAELTILARLAVVAPIAPVLSIVLSIIGAIFTLTIIGTIAVLTLLPALRPAAVAATLIGLVAVLRNKAVASGPAAGVVTTLLLAAGVHAAAVIVTLVVVLGAVLTQTRAGVAALIARLLQLLTIRHDDAVVVLGVLEIVLSQDRIARGLGIAGERQIFLGDVRGRTPDLDVGTIGLKAARQRVLLVFPVAVVVALTITVAIVIWPTATAAILLTLPHCR